MADEISTLMTSCQGKSVLLRLRNNKTVQGNLVDFDIHMNLTLDTLRMLLIQGLSLFEIFQKR